MRIGILLITAVLLLAGSVLTVTGAASAAEPASEAVKLPKEVHLTDALTPVYDAMNGGFVYDASPQTVPVTGAETNWERKLLNGDKVWFKLDASGRERWVQLQNPEFEDGYYNYVVLMGEERLYGDRTARMPSLGVISPQVVRSLYTEAGSYLIETWLGYKWIHPAHPVIPNVEYAGASSSGFWVQLQTPAPLFDIPDAGSPVAGLLSPQTVVSKVRLSDNWYYIDTWEGRRWVNPKVGYPTDLRSEDSSLTLTGQTKVYEHPNQKARIAGVLGAQTVPVFERGGGWHHIHSDWLGDVWIYQVSGAADPAAYVPPAAADAVPVNAQWNLQEGIVGTGWRNFPFDLTTIVANADGVINPEQAFAFGQSAFIQVGVKNVGTEAVTLHPSARFELEIVRMQDTDENLPSQLVWSGTLPALDAKLNSGASGSLTVEWNQKDADGKQVPFGLYSVQFKLPMTIDYVKEGDEQPQRQQAQSAILTHFIIRVGAP
ncbi:hypothetical protein [Paenibacillus piri]|uniref:Intracellular proteinase inhibitor BsuPI domain-containing protein n=1 Tax=Paenibacillus piri TaxID=2547395 RepID=A0A4R5KZL6_9BACL|nr:hypothetical protein [Paenibacillus piri]TDG00749.1 hypothetical protein E1757_03760 [Paenibacillus piri]